MQYLMAFIIFAVLIFFAAVLLFSKSELKRKIVYGIAGFILIGSAGSGLILIIIRTLNQRYFNLSFPYWLTLLIAILGAWLSVNYSKKNKYERLVIEKRLMDFIKYSVWFKPVPSVIYSKVRTENNTVIYTLRQGNYLFIPLILLFLIFVGMFKLLLSEIRVIICCLIVFLISLKDALLMYDRKRAVRSQTINQPKGITELVLEMPAGSKL